MSTLEYIIIFSIIGSVGSLIGGVLLLVKEKFALRISHFLTAFAAGALLSTAFFDLLPEAQEVLENSESDINIYLWTLIGILGFFILERFIHHHDTSHGTKEKNTVVPLIVVGDSVHNFIDGVAMAATFLVSIPLGIVTSLAVAAHEIPQEIGDFGLMLGKGVKASKVLLINFFSALIALVGAILTYINQEALSNLLPAILALAAGFFIYISAANLIPEIHNREDQKLAFWESIFLFFGVLVVYFAITMLEHKT